MCWEVEVVVGFRGFRDFRGRVYLVVIRVCGGGKGVSEEGEGRSLWEWGDERWWGGLR